MIRYLSKALVMAIISISVEASEIERRVDNVFNVGAEIPIELRYFTQLMGGNTLADARNRFNCLRKTNPDIPVAIVAFPTPKLKITRPSSITGMRPSFPYSVVVASYATEIEAHQSLYWARKNIDFQPLFKCLGFDKTGDPSILDGQFYVYELHVKKQNWPRLVERAPLPSFNGIGYTRTQYASVSQDFIALIKRKIYTNIEEVKAELAAIRSLYPEIAFAAIKQGEYYYLAAASNVEKSTLDEAIMQMRRRGLYEYTYLARISSEVEVSKVQQAPRIVGILSQASDFDVKPNLETVKSSLTISVLDMQDLVSPVQERVKSCFDKVKTKVSSTGENLELGLPMEEFAACSGVVLDNKGITKCLLDSSCTGLRVPLHFNILPQKLVRECLAGNVELCTGTVMDPLFQTVFNRLNGVQCLDNGASPACEQVMTLLNKLCEDPANLESCTLYPTLMSSIPQRFTDMLSCVRNGHCQSIVPRPPNIDVVVAQEVERIKTTTEGLVRPVKEGLAMLSKTTDELVMAFKACQNLAASKDNKEQAKICFARLSLTPDELNTLSCFAAADDQNRTDCFLKDNRLREVVTQANCLKAAGTDLTAMAKCSGQGDLAKIEEKYKCATGEQSALKAVLKCNDTLPPEMTTAIKCIESSNSVEDKVLACLPEQSEGVKTARCIATSKSDAERLSCLHDAIPMDPTAKKTLACAIAANGDTQATATCAIGEIIPGDLGKALSCGTTSTGAVDFALCVAGPQMNAELRMAAECAASTGGEPISFASCTAGRLTVAELTKCMSGKIGQEGGCFGPNNTIVKTLNNAIHDLTHGLGDGNDLVKGYRELQEIGNKLVEPLVDLGRTVGRVLDDIVDGAKRGDVGRTLCNWFGC
ncbi:hypothetical protein [Pseudomonas sp. CCOS 191]|uniref:hypothetical protein n=1 Tax=Pseudomonas sp. CCOS 191 TaxID=1649877 RepID=UPI000624CDCD|nr:hypothetical protein [Pseudomonas sp. CCOS 191]CRI56775.1 hypothetical protein CCOS191_2239 [Pseudomonas sp. CCOS 191]